MSYILYDTEALVLARYPRGEADNVIRLYTEQFGMIMVHAKAVRMEKSKLRGALDIGTHLRVSFVRGKEANRLIDAETIQQFPLHISGRAYDVRFRTLSALMRFMAEVASEEHTEPDFWRLSMHACEYIYTAEHISEDEMLVLLYTFQARALHMLGYMPETCPAVVETLLTGADVVPPLSYKELTTPQVKTFFAEIYRYAMRQERTPADFS